MSTQPPTSWEVEITFAVAADTTAPDWTQLPGITQIGEETVYELCAEYFDTKDLELSQARTALRRRTGGKDAGWHIKRQAAGGREEFHAPLADEIPAELLAQLPAQYADPRQLHKIAQIENRRTEILLYDASGEAIAEFCDDHVNTVSYIVSPPLKQHWREWEIEITAAGQAAGYGTDFLEAATKLCQQQGAQHRPDSSKLQRTLYGENH